MHFVISCVDKPGHGRVRADNRAAAEAFVADDPYAKAGLFESVTIRPWRKVYPAD